MTKQPSDFISDKKYFTLFQNLILAFSAWNYPFQTIDLQLNAFKNIVLCQLDLVEYFEIE